MAALLKKYLLVVPKTLSARTVIFIGLLKRTDKSDRSIDFYQENTDIERKKKVAKSILKNLKFFKYAGNTPKNPVFPWHSENK